MCVTLCAPLPLTLFYDHGSLPSVAPGIPFSPKVHSSALPTFFDVAFSLPLVVESVRLQVDFSEDLKNRNVGCLCGSVG